MHRARSRPSLRGLRLSLRMSSFDCMYVCLSRFGSPWCVCVQKSEVKMQPAIQPSSPPSERREKKGKGDDPAVHPRTVLSLSLGIESNPPNSKSNNDVVELEKDFRRERREREEYIEVMQCCHQKSIQDRQGCASTSFFSFPF